MPEATGCPEKPLPAGNSRVDFHNITVAGDMGHSMFFPFDEECHHVVRRNGKPLKNMFECLIGRDFDCFFSPASVMPEMSVIY